MLTYNRDTNFDSCEQLIAASRRQSDETRYLKLATRLNLRSHPSGSASFSQALISWARHQREPVLITHAQSPVDADTIENLVRRLYGFVGAMMATDIMAVDGRTSVRRAAYADARKYAVAMDEERFTATAPGVAVNLVCVDHSTLGYLRPFYYGPELDYRLRSETDFLDLTARILNASVSDASRRRIPDSDVRVLGGVLRELFANTHDHGRTDVEGRPWRRSVRGIHAAHHMVRVDSLERYSSGFPPLGIYLAAHREGLKGQHIAFWEVSVFDSGPGFAARILKRPIEPSDSLKDEYEAVNECFLKHISSKPRKTDGLGLFRTMGLLKMHGGFLRLRTGRLSLFKAFKPNPNRTVSELQEEDILLNDAINGVPHDVNAAAAVEGALVSIFLPVGGGFR